jgi:hypothetical protein
MYEGSRNLELALNLPPRYDKFRYFTCRTTVSTLETMKLSSFFAGILGLTLLVPSFAIKPVFLIRVRLISTSVYGGSGGC